MPMFAIEVIMISQLFTRQHQVTVVEVRLMMAIIGSIEMELMELGTAGQIPDLIRLPVKQVRACYKSVSVSDSFYLINKNGI